MKKLTPQERQNLLNGKWSSNTNLDFIKWLMEKAGEPYKVNVHPNCTTIEIPGREHAFFIEEFEWKCPDYVKAHLLQSAIEGFNLEPNIACSIENRMHGIYIVNIGNRDIIEIFMFDEICTVSTKKLALQYVWEREDRG